MGNCGVARVRDIAAAITAIVTTLTLMTISDLFGFIPIKLKNLTTLSMNSPAECEIGRRIIYGIFRCACVENRHVTIVNGQTILGVY